MSSTIYGTNEKLMVDDHADSDGELGISMAVTACDADAGSAHTWLSMQDAQKLIEHLKSAFPDAANNS